jgi:excisionase family DNA binding protein
MEPLIIRIPDACRMIGVGRSKLYELLAAGEIEAVKIGARRLILLASLREFVEANREPRP